MIPRVLPAPKEPPLEPATTADLLVDGWTAADVGDYRNDVEKGS